VGPGCQARRGRAQLGRLGRGGEGGEVGAARFGPKTAQPRGEGFSFFFFLFSISLPFSIFVSFYFLYF
jgi:hypothetical protein